MMNDLKLIIQRQIYLVLFLGGLFAYAFSSCNKEDNQEDIVNDVSLASEVIGTYAGTLKNSSANESRSATLTVTKLNDSLVSMHCVAEDFDSTIVNLLYQNFDSVMTCYSGQDFNNQYGHYLNNYNFCNNMPNDWNSGWCNNNSCWSGEDNWNAWTNHMNTQHNQNDIHFGGFNPALNSCNYKFNIYNATTSYFEVFDGNKNN